VVEKSAWARKFSKRLQAAFALTKSRLPILCSPADYMLLFKLFTHNHTLLFL